MPLFSALTKPGVRIINEKLNLCMICFITISHSQGVYKDSIQFTLLAGSRQLFGPV